MDETTKHVDVNIYDDHAIQVLELGMSSLFCEHSRTRRHERRAYGMRRIS